MIKTNNNLSTSDKTIRESLRKFLKNELTTYRKKGHKSEIFEELGVKHGSARIDFAIVNGVMCGYEIKSDRDTLERLPEQVKEFSEVFDKLTLVVGKRYLYQAIYEIPDWWGIMLAKENTRGKIILQTIREPRKNTVQKEISVARLLWREEALRILEGRQKADSVRYKPREFVYQKLVNVFSFKELKQHVSSTLISREGWRSDQQLAIHGD